MSAGGPGAGGGFGGAKKDGKALQEQARRQSGAYGIEMDKAKEAPINLAQG